MAILSPLSPLKGLGRRKAVQAAGPPTSGLSLWYKADSLLGTYSDGDTITSWTDSTSNAVIAMAGNSPIFRTNVLHSTEPVVDLSGNAYFSASVNPSGISAGAPRTVISVVKFNGAGGAIFTFRTSVAYQSAMALGGTNPYVNGDGATSFANEGISADLTSGQWYIITHKYNGTGNLINVRINGVEPVSYYWPGGNGQSTESGTDGFSIGNNAVGQTWSSPVAEILVYDSALSDGSRIAAQTYLNTKYAIF